MHVDYNGGAEEELFEGPQAVSNAPLPQLPAYLDEAARDQRKEISFTEVWKKHALLIEWEADGQSFANQDLRDSQLVLNR